MFSFFKKFLKPGAPAPEPGPPAEPAPAASTAPGALSREAAWAPAPGPESAPAVTPGPAASAPGREARGNQTAEAGAPTSAAPAPANAESGSLIGSALHAPIRVQADVTPARARWLDRLRDGLRKTGGSIASVFTGTQVDETLYEELESALLLADAGVGATEHLLAEVKRRVKDAGVTHPVAVRNILVESLASLLKPLERSLVIGEHTPTVIMVAGVNGAGKTTSIGKLTRHLADEGASVLLAAADTFRAAAREQLQVWAQRNTVDIVSQEGGDPAAVSFDAVSAGKARGKDVVLVDTAGRLPTQLHLMEELKKIKRVITKAEGSAPHEVLLVIDGNTGQNALAQVKAFDEALHLTGLIVTKLDGTAKGGVLAAIALWATERQKKNPALRPVPVYFIGVGEKLEDLETFHAREFAQALLG